uniref:Uncharacterized protein n=1 Tax=Rhizophora mucronata TaxID=61149 RepID=A0A2P2QBU2_RHIMU
MVTYKLIQHEFYYMSSASTFNLKYLNSLVKGMIDITDENCSMETLPVATRHQGCVARYHKFCPFYQEKDKDFWEHACAHACLCL